MSPSKLRDIIYSACDNHEFIGISFENPNKLHLWYYCFKRDHGAGGAVCTQPYNRIFEKQISEKDFKYLARFYMRFLNRKIEEGSIVPLYHL